MIQSRLKILFDIFLEPAEDEEDIRSYFISRGEDPEQIIERAKNIVKQKEAKIKLKVGKDKQNKAAEFLKNLKEVRSEKQEESFLDNVGFAYRKNNNGSDNDEELRKQAEKLDKLKKHLRGSDEHTGES